MRTKILLADDHQVVLDGLKAVLGTHADLELVGQANDGLEVMPLCEKLQPDVLVVDLMMPGMNGLEATRQVHERWPQLKIVVLSMHSTDAYVVEALRNGASGYVLKQSHAGELLQAIRAVMAGGRYLSPPLSEENLHLYREKARSGAVDPFNTLTEREREVLQLAAEGLTNIEIGKRLEIGKRTVETHRANLTRKLALRTQADLVRYAVRRGIVAPE